MAATLETFASSIVVVGTFNPPIFTPDWLEHNKLVGSDDADKARQSENIVITRQLARFETDWFVLQITDQQFSLTSKGPLNPAISDLAIGSLSLVSHTPIKALGLNFLAHYKMGTIDEYHKIGDALAPKEVWNALFPGENQSAGLLDVTIVIEPARRGTIPTSSDRKRLTVQPSNMVKPGGIFLSYNDHHGVEGTDSAPTKSAEWCVDLIEKQWQSVWEDAKRVFEGVLASV